MKRILIVLMITAVAFGLVCCDAESIAKAGKSLHDIRNVNKADVTGIAKESLQLATGYIKTLIDEERITPAAGDMEPNDLKMLVGLVNQVKETTAPTEVITNFLNQTAIENPGEKIYVNIKKTVDDFLSNIEREDFQESVIKMVETFSEGMGDKAKEALQNQLSRVVTIVRSIEPAVDAVQSIIDQAYNHVGMTYGDIIARATLFDITKELTVLLTGSGNENTKMDIVNKFVSYLGALEVIYNVTFDVPQIAANFVGNL